MVIRDYKIKVVIYGMVGYDYNSYSNNSSMNDAVVRKTYPLEGEEVPH